MRPDPAHASQERAFHRALWRDDPPPGLTAPDPGEVARRFAVYRNNVQHGLTRAVAARFPVVERLVGPAFFAAMARVFAAAHPPRSPVLIDWAGNFADFLEAFPPAAGLPYLADVARIEWTRGRVYHAADAASIAPDALSAANPAATVLHLHPALALFASSYPVVSIWSAHQGDATPRPIGGTGPEQALIARTAGFAVIVEPLDPASHAVLSALAAGEPLGCAAELGDPAPALAILLRHGLITALDQGDCP